MGREESQAVGVIAEWPGLTGLMRLRARVGAYWVTSPSLNKPQGVSFMATQAEKIRDGSDYFKAVFGVRPHVLISSEVAWDVASAEMEHRKSTPEGRNALRDAGWMLEGDPEYGYREDTAYVPPTSA